MQAKVGKFKRHWLGRPASVYALVMLAPFCALAPAVQAQPTNPPAAGVKTGPSGMPLPRFASLKSDRVNMRKGPGTQYPIAWIYRRAGLPVEIINEYENWREVRDAEGTSGWVFRPLLSNRRTAQLLPWKVEGGKPPPVVELRASSSHGAPAVVAIEAGVIAALRSCDGAWCYVSVGQFQGHVEQDQLWGVYKKEQIR